MEINQNLKHKKELELISKFLTPSNYLIEETKKEIAKLFLLLVEDYIKKTNGETFYRLPYKEISEKIYENRELSIRSNELISFSETVSREISILYTQLNDEEKVGRESLEHIHECFNKFIQYISLALAQKAFILESAEEASKIAMLAKKQAKKAKNMSNNMVTNFVTILGIFATIIITVFGGINLIGSTVKLLEGNSRLSYIVFVVSFLMVCLLTLIQMLTLWISKLNNKEINTFNDSENNDQGGRFSICNKWRNFSLYTKSILILSLLILLSFICICYLPNSEGSGKKENPSNMYNSETRTGININIDSNSEKLSPKPIVNTLEPIIQEMLDEDSKK